MGIGTALLGTFSVLLDREQARSVADRLAILRYFPEGHPVRLVHMLQQALLDVTFGNAPDAEPSLRRLALSNGVALHRSWQAACQCAVAELLERDAVLRSFRGECTPEPVAFPDSPPAQALRGSYTLRAFTFDGGEGSAYITAGVFLCPLQAQVDPLAFGFAAARELQVALAAAERETAG